ncbi:MAG: L,D-transpeptidase family protein [Erythrobacter sp.]|nr:MAG: L,D-transpeptidase family protein [Erythrobacter sp.]
MAPACDGAASDAAALGAIDAAGTTEGEAQDAAAGLVAPREVERAALEKAVTDERVRALYEARGWEAAWTDESARALVGTLKDAGRHGLDPGDYLRSLQQAARSPAAREAALTAAAFAYADALADGRADPTALFETYTLDRPDIDLSAGLESALAEGRASEWIESFAPDTEEYRALSEAFLENARKAAARGDSTIGGGDLIRPGSSDPRVPQIAERLRAKGYLGEARRGNVPETRFTERMADALREMQRDFGIADDGIVGPDALKVLNTAAEERARLLAVNLERLRWLERDRPLTRIDVNIAAARLDYYEDGAVVDSRKVIVGQPGWETPQLGSPIYRLVANPTWTVPKSIEREEIEPRGAGYLARNNMVRRDGWIVQLPGPGNALGEVKFDMENDQAIYLHDTPAVSLFERNQRHFSHGCVRVEDAPGFARMLAREADVISEYRPAKASGEESFVRLPQQIPVRLLYRTAFVGREGEVEYRTDVYGWDNRIAQALGYEPREAPRIEISVSDVGP